MKSILLIGLGAFGQHLCRQLVKMNNDVLIVDKNEEALESMSQYVSGKIIADCTSLRALEQLGVQDFDLCFVCIGNDFKSNLMIVSQLKELGAKHIVSETRDELLEKLLLSNGADNVINPDKYSAESAAVKFSSDFIYDYRHLRGDFSIYEITPLPEWVGKTIFESRIREIYGASIIAVTQANGKLSVVPNPKYKIMPKDRLMLLANDKTIKVILNKLDRTK